MNPDPHLKFYSIVDHDLMWCQRYLVAYIELLTPREPGELDAWSTLRSREHPGEHNFLDILGRSLAQSVIVSYWRPWSKNKGEGGPRRLCASILSDMKQMIRREEPRERLLPFDEALHDRVHRARDKIVAHSDPDEWRFDVNRLATGTNTRLEDPFEYLSLEEARTLLSNTESLRSELAERRRRLRSSPESHP